MCFVAIDQPLLIESLIKLYVQGHCHTDVIYSHGGGDTHRMESLQTRHAPAFNQFKDAYKKNPQLYIATCVSNKCTAIGSTNECP